MVWVSTKEEEMNRLEQINQKYGIDTPDAAIIQDGTCWKCGGARIIRGLEMVDGGVCYHCSGRGRCSCWKCNRTLGSLRKAARRRDAKEAKIAAKIEKTTAEWNLWKEANAELVATWEAQEARSDFIQNVLSQKKVPTDKQIEALNRSVAKLTEIDKLEPLTPGRRDLHGILVSIKFEENHYSYHGGTIPKAVIKLDSGHRIYGTLPRGVSAEKGIEIEFTATVEPSKTDNSFGFYKRPVLKKA